MKFKTQFSYTQTNKGYTNKKPSEAIEGQSFTLPKVIERLRNGLPISVKSSGYNPDGFPKFDDLTTLDAFKQALQQKEKIIEEKINAIKLKEAQERSEPADEAK